MTSLNSFTNQISLQCRHWLSDFQPPPFSISSYGVTQLESLNSNSSQVRPDVNYVLPTTSTIDAGMLSVTIAEEFARAGGHVIWIGTTRDLYRMSERLMFKIAGLASPSDDTEVRLDIIAHLNLIDARAEMMTMWIDFCNVEDCGDVALEQEFVAAMSTFKPTLIVVDPSITDDRNSDPFEFLIRNTYGIHMVERLQEANPESSVLWASSSVQSVPFYERNNKAI
jgi:hypothetical protein